MLLSSIMGTEFQRQLNKADGRKPALNELDLSAKSKRKIDTVEISAEAKSHFEKIRSRISGGFYNTEQVAQDISDKLGRVMDELDH